MLNVKLGGIKYHFFLVFCMTQPEIEFYSSGPLVNTIGQWAGSYSYSEITTSLHIQLYSTISS